MRFEHLFYPGPMRAIYQSLEGHTRPRHVWINVTGGAGDTQPGLLLDWRQVADPSLEWQALVVWADGGGLQTPRAVTAWVKAEHVRPV